MQLLRQRWLLQGVVKNSKNLGGAKVPEMKRLSREEMRGKSPAGELARAKKSGKTRRSLNKNIMKCHFIEGLFKAGVDYNIFHT